MNGLGSSPYATCVGGTQSSTRRIPSTYWNTTNDPVDEEVRQGRRPRDAWNESGGRESAATGGGKSILFARPPWQNVAGLPAGRPPATCRTSRSPAPAHTPYIIVQGHTTGATGLYARLRRNVRVVSCLRGHRGAPVAEGRHAARQPEPAPLRGRPRAVRRASASAPAPLAAGARFHDVTTGKNTVPGVTGYAAGPGYDAATGLGSVDAAALAAALPAPAPALDGLHASARIPRRRPPGVVGSVVVNLALDQTGAADADAVATRDRRRPSRGRDGRVQPGNSANTAVRASSRAARTRSSTFAPRARRRRHVPRSTLTATSGSVVRRVTLFVTVGSGAATPPSRRRSCRRRSSSTSSARPLALHVGLRRREPSGTDATLLLVYVPAAGARAPRARHRALARPRAGSSTFPTSSRSWPRTATRSLRTAPAKLGTLFATFVGVIRPARVFAGSRTSTPNPGLRRRGLRHVRGGRSVRERDLVRRRLDLRPARERGLPLEPRARPRARLRLGRDVRPRHARGPDLRRRQRRAGGSAAHAAPSSRASSSSTTASSRSTPTGVTNGYARVRLTSGTDRFIAYGVVNDGGSAGGGTSDGSFLARERDGGPRPDRPRPAGRAALHDATSRSRTRHRRPSRSRSRTRRRRRSRGGKRDEDDDARRAPAARASRTRSPICAASGSRSRRRATRAARSSSRARSRSRARRTRIRTRASAARSASRIRRSSASGAREGRGVGLRPAAGRGRAHEPRDRGRAGRGRGGRRVRRGRLRRGHRRDDARPHADAHADGRAVDAVQHDPRRGRDHARLRARAAVLRHVGLRRLRRRERRPDGRLAHVGRLVRPDGRRELKVA